MRNWDWLLERWLFSLWYTAKSNATAIHTFELCKWSTRKRLAGHSFSVRDPQFWKALPTVIHQSPDLLTSGNAAKSVIFFFIKIIGGFGLNRCVYRWSFYSCLTFAFHSWDPGTHLYIQTINVIECHSSGKPEFRWGFLFTLNKEVVVAVASMNYIFTNL